MVPVKRREMSRDRAAYGTNSTPLQAGTSNAENQSQFRDERWEYGCCPRGFQA
jgi:hypothetical protein